MSNRVNDSRGEKALAIFLDTYFYDNLMQIENFAKIEREYNVSEQKLGTDVIISNISGGTMHVDEKAQLHYINNPRERFAFEIEYYHPEHETLMEGWFVSDTNKTDCYLLMWIDNAKEERLNRIVAEDFEEVTAYLIPKKKIRKFVENKGFQKNDLLSVAKKMRNGELPCDYPLDEGIKMYFTNGKDKIDENPINLVIEREHLKKLSYGIYKIKKENVLKLAKQ